jgi:dTDP-4-amino-4,6-dideoxygalactose transaminase
MDEIMALARARNLRVIEDCAHAIESTYRGRAVGTFGDLGCFSFYVTKNVTSVEGGMVISNDHALADRIKMLALHGLSRDAWRRYSDPGYIHYEVIAPGFKYNMTDLQAAIGLAQLERVEEHAKRRAEIWDVYQQELRDLPCALPAPVPERMTHARHLFTVLVDEAQLRIGRDEVLKALTAENIGVGVHYVPVHQHSYYREAFGWSDGDLPNASRIGARTVSLPLSGGLGRDEVADVVEAVRRVLTYYRR